MRFYSINELQKIKFNKPFIDKATFIGLVKVDIPLITHTLVEKCCHITKHKNIRYCHNGLGKS